MSSPGSRATRNPVRAIKRALTERCASTCKGRQAGDLGLEITQGRGLQIGDTARIRRRLRSPRRRNQTYRGKSYSGAPEEIRTCPQIRIRNKAMQTHWNYRPALEGERSEMAHRTATSELLQAGHFHDQAQIVAVFAGWRLFATPYGTVRAEAGDILAIPSG